MVEAVFSAVGGGRTVGRLVGRGGRTVGGGRAVMGWWDEWKSSRLASLLQPDPSVGGFCWRGRFPLARQLPYAQRLFVGATQVASFLVEPAHRQTQRGPFPFARWLFVGATQVASFSYSTSGRGIHPLPFFRRQRIHAGDFGFCRHLARARSRRPLPGRVQNAQNAHHVAGQVINQDVIAMRYQFAGAGNATRPAQVGMIEQQTCFHSENNSSRASAAAGACWAMYSRIAFRSVCAGRVHTSLTT